MKFGICSIWGGQGYIVYIDSKKIIWLVCLSLLTAVIGVVIAIFQYEIIFGITSISYAAMMLLFLLWHQPVLSCLLRRRTGKSTYKLTKSFNDMAVNQLEKFSVEIECTQIKISTAIIATIRNINAFAETSENESDNLADIIEKAKNLNNVLFLPQRIDPIRDDLDALCSHIIIVGQKGLIIIDQIQSSVKAVAQLMSDFESNPDFYTSAHPKTRLDNGTNELRSILDVQKRINHKSINNEIDALKKIAINIKKHRLASTQKSSLPLDNLSGLLSLSTRMTSVAVNLVQLSQMIENTLTVLLKMCELSVLFNSKSQAFMTSSKNIKSKLYQVLTKIRQDKNTDLSSEEAALLELESINTLVKELVFDCPK